MKVKWVSRPTLARGRRNAALVPHRSVRGPTNMIHLGSGVITPGAPVERVGRSDD